MKREFSHTAASVRGATCLCHHWDPRSLTSMVSAHDPAQSSLGAIKDSSVGAPRLEICS